MQDPGSDAVAEMVDEAAIHRLHTAFADIVNRRAFTELHGLFLPDAPVVVDRRNTEPLVLEGPGALGEFVRSSIEPFDFFEFVVLNARVAMGHDGDRDQATARMYMNELRHERATGRFSIVYGLYQDRYQRVAGRWWFAERRYHSLARTGPAFAVFDHPDDARFEST